MQDKSFFPVDVDLVDENIVAMVTDRNYSKYAEVMLYQLSKHSPWRTVCILIDGDETLEVELSNKAKSLGLIPLTFIMNEWLEILSQNIAKQRISRVALSRLFLPDLLPAHIKKVLYLDLDLLIRRSLEPICNFELKLPLAAVGNRAHRMRRLLGTPDVSSFNSGVMLMDCAKWRAVDSKGQFEQILREGLPMPFMDEILANLVFKDKWQQLPVTANVYSDPKVRTQLVRGPENPIIVHFLGPAKPWVVVTGRYSLEWRRMQRASGITTQVSQFAKFKATVWFFADAFGRTTLGFRMLRLFSGGFKKSIKRAFRL